MNKHLITSARWATAGFTLALCAFGATIGGLQANAQAIAAHNSNAPVSTAADRMELQERQKRFVLSGNVDVTQGDLRLRTARALVNYTDAGLFDIQRLTATGGVQVTRGNEAASGDVAVYDFNRRIITMAGNVRLRRGGDTLSGGRLVIDLQSGISSIDGSASQSSAVVGSGEGATRSNGRVTGTFTVPQK